MNVSRFSIVAFCTLFAPLLHYSEATNEAGVNKTLTAKGLERVSIYQESIKYWDTENVEIRQAILKELAIGEDVKFPGCPRIRYPIICDNDKILLENSCYFRMRRRERSGLLPIMVFTTTPIEIARQKCQNGI